MPQQSIANSNLLKKISPHTTYPITLTHMEQVVALVIGGGQVGERKIKGLLAVQAIVQLISPQITPQLQQWVEQGVLTWQARSYQTGDLMGAHLVFAATNQRMVNAQVAQDAASLNILCNVADDPDAGNFHVPAVHRTDDIMVAVSTGGDSPTRAKERRNQIAKMLRNL